MKIKNATISDIEELAKVEIESKIASIPEIVTGIDIDYAARLQRWHTYFKGESPKSSKPERLILKAEISEKIVGYIAGHLTTRYEKDAEIQSFYMLKEHHRNGIGKTLLNRFVQWALNQHAKSLCVGIAPENKYQAFYLKYGGQNLNPHWIYWDNLQDLIKLL